MVKQNDFFLHFFNPLLHIGHYSVSMAKISISKLGGKIKKIV